MGNTHRPFENQIALITGASSGIGESLAHCFAAEGARCVLTARREDRLSALALSIEEAGHPQPMVVVADLFEPGAPQAIINEVGDQLGPVDVLINNAGLGFVGPFSGHSPEEVSRMLTVNIDALVQLTHLVLPEMLGRRRGWIMNVASAAAYQPMAYMSAYAATKAFVLSFSEGVWAEVRRKGVAVTCVNPGTTRTEFFDHHAWNEARKKMLAQAMTADKVAKIAINALKKRKSSVTCGTVNRILVTMGHWVPRRVVAKLTAKLLKPSKT